jgi:F420-dependent oxidoreductase-like protein
MKVSLHVPIFTWSGGPPEIAATLTTIARTAEDAGFDSITVMDHHFQMELMGSAEMDMLEAYTTLGYIAGQTSRIRLGALVTGVTYRHPGILIKQVTTLDLLSGGRAFLGIGAAWYEREHLGLGVPFPTLKERFERLEETLQIAHQMWNSDNNGAYNGKYYQLAETLNSPQSLQRPHPKIMIGGTGEKKTLRLVAKYADACNIFAHEGIPFVEQRLDVLREHCDREGRDYSEIEKTATTMIMPGPNGENVGQLVDQFGKLAEAGIETVHITVIGVDSITPLEAIGRDVIPQVASL